MYGITDKFSIPFSAIKIANRKNEILDKRKFLITSNFSLKVGYYLYDEPAVKNCLVAYLLPELK